jgi:hypothetical protein
LINNYIYLKYSILKAETGEISHERPQPGTRTPTEGPDFDFERFRADILGAIE